MELRHLRYFVAVADSLNFSRAAERLHVAQPALSRQIKDLEDEIGVQLLVRNRVKVQVTEAGRIFHAHAVKILTHSDLAVTAAQEAARGHDGKLVICNDWRLPLDAVPQAVVYFKSLYPRVEVTLKEMRVYEQLAALRAGRIHIAFVPRVYIGMQEEFDLMPIVRSEVVALLPADRRVPSRKKLPLRDLSREQWVWIDDKHARGYRLFITQLCRLAGFTPVFRQSSESIQGMIALVATGSGVTIVPQIVVPPAHGMLQVIPTDCEPIELCAVWLRAEPSPLLRNFVSVLRERVQAVASA